MGIKMEKTTVCLLVSLLIGLMLFAGNVSTSGAKLVVDEISNLFFIFVKH
jgi:hypothetical protein